MSVIVKGMEMPQKCDDCFLQLRFCTYAMRPDGKCPLVEAPEWISVEERLPEKYHQVLCYGKNGILVDYYSGETSVLDRPLFMVSEARVSHWMPLPSTEGLNET